MTDVRVPPLGLKRIKYTLGPLGLKLSHENMIPRIFRQKHDKLKFHPWIKRPPRKFIEAIFFLKNSVKGLV